MMTKLNLPLGYNKLSEYYDALSLSAGNVDLKNRLIAKILKKHKVKTVLDMTCGTGSQVLWLAKHGYKITGSDFSPNLLKIAKHKAKKEKIKVKFLEGDMRTIQVGQFDAVITIFNAIGHLTKTGFEKAIRNIRNNLNQGGLYIFDIFNFNSLTNKVLENMKMDITKKVEDITIHNVQYSVLDKRNKRLVSYDTFSLQKNAGKPKILKGKFTLQIYTPKELREILAKNGFTVLGQYSMDGSKFSENKTKEILTVARC